MTHSVYRRVRAQGLAYISGLDFLYHWKDLEQRKFITEKSF